LILANNRKPLKVAILAQAGVALGFFGGGHPGRPLGFLERAPTGRHAAEDGADAHLGVVRGLEGMARVRLIWPNCQPATRSEPRIYLIEGNI